jgi:hypothetical protein
LRHKNAIRKLRARSSGAGAGAEIPVTLIAIMLGLCVGVLVGILGIGGGIVLVPALTLLLGFGQHRAQGTSLFMQLPPLGLGALLLYWRNGLVDRRSGVACAIGIFLGGYLGSRAAIGIGPETLKGLFGGFLLIAAVALWRRPAPGSGKATIREKQTQLATIFVLACGVGVLSGLLGVGGGILLVPLLVLGLGFEQHVAQGTSLVALVPPTGLLAFLNYARAGEVDWKVGLLIMPGIFLGGLAGGKIALRLQPSEMRRGFAILLLPIGTSQIVAALLHR